MKKILKNKNIVFIIMVAVLIAGFFIFWYYREQVFSKEILKLEILGPDTAVVGQEIEYMVTYKNNGNFSLENPKLIFQLPDNSLTEDSKLRLEQELGDIYPGDQRSIIFKARLLGKEQDVKIAHAWLSYTPHNLSARYERDTTFPIKLEVVPITLTYDLPSKLEKGKEITYSVNYFSNVDYPLENLSLKIEPLDGFSIKSAQPSSLDNVEWKLETLSKAQGGRISITGVVEKETGSALPFLAQLGMWQGGRFVLIKEAKYDVEVIRPLLFISQHINGSDGYVASPGEKLHYVVFIRNISNTPFNDVFIEGHLEGEGFDASTLSSSDGQIRFNDKSIIWPSNQILKLRHLAPNQEISVAFDVILKNDWTISESEKNNVSVKNSVTVSGTNQIFKTPVNSNLNISQKANTQDQTSYLVTWRASNDFNDVKNIKVRAVLPEGVAIVDNIIPEDEALHFSWDNSSREMVWLAGDLSAGSAKNLTFEVMVSLPLIQVGQSIIVSQATISGEDQFTGAIIKVTAPAISTY
ncbi:MAG: hypothetical protein A3D44_02905 [Candidatus Staskawiczbacteria bacterium RIFCSPHIGHO2_02_FULL_42_22]|uniref:DUF11 domain-containing protein n=1 Tax=Candidatus Staskawiczbacteria bacterium RIFCSPHIGHO2_02_FULL_42_22 TaxID=1802207 RepID=A0A1G2I5Q0_9BACT|nr:MAG: hypothetical protein A3D44_02905 [Candidatus Staskawiczbacteria bacterium RIFCSPHIGHO2_02_FULL_42_22]